MRVPLSLIASGWFCLPAWAGGFSYQITLNAAACHEVHLGRFSVPQGLAPVISDGVTNGQCRSEIRSDGDAGLYFAIACAGRPGSWPTAPEKYAVSLSDPGRVRRIDEAIWQAAPVLPRSEKGGPPRPDQSGYRYMEGSLLERSGPSWYGKGYPPPIFTHLSWSMTRAAVNSWDGIAFAGDILDIFMRPKIKGHFWIDIYETSSAEPLVRISGSFRGALPHSFMGVATFYSDRYYVMPAGRVTASGEFGMKQLLICDLDAAARKGSPNPSQRK